MDSAIHYLQLQSADDVVSVCEQLRFLRGRRVALVWPEQGAVLPRKLDLLLVQREALRSGVRLALVTHDAATARHADELNISAFETISSSKRRRWKRGRSRAFVNRSRRPINAPLTDELAPYASRLRGEDTASPRARAIGGLLRIAAFALFACILGGLLLALGPGASITLTPATQLVQASVSITADPAVAQSAIDVENGLIPAITYRAEVEERGTLPASGQQSLGSTPATGSVTFVNRTSTRVDIPAGALVSTSAGTPIVFRTTADVAVPASAQADAPVEAVIESSGAVGNVEAGLINTVIGPLAEQLDVLNTSPTFGGENRSARVITESDRDALISMLRQQIQDRAFRDLAPLAADGQFIIPETIRITEERSDWMTFDHAVGDFADSLTMTMRAVVAVTAVDEALAQQIAYARLGAQVPRGRAIEPASLTYTQGALTAIDATGRATFDMQVQAAVRARFDSAALAARLAGIPYEAALDYLSTQLDLQPGAAPVIELTPAWFGRMPLLPLRITIQSTLAEGA